jgi:prepilin peptidase CpaA
MTPIYYAATIATCAILIISVFTDIRYGKILNVVTLPFAILGIVLNTMDKGWGGILFSVEGILLGLALFFLSAFLGRILGAGDCKLFAAVGALQGPYFLLWVILYSLLAGGVLALLVALWRRVLLRSLDRVWRSVYMRLFLETPMDITGAGEKMRIPYALAICAGGLLVLLHSGAAC